MPQVILKPRKARPFFGRHPWVLDSAIDRIHGSPADGDVVDLISDKDKFIARGIYNSRSRIRVRLYSWRSDEPIDDGFWRKKLEAASQLRQHLGYDDPQGAARVVFSEGDLLSGLVVDRFANYLVVQVTALAMAVRLETILSQLLDLLRPTGIVLRTERDVAKAEGLDENMSGTLCRDDASGRRQKVPDAVSLGWGELPQGPLTIVDGGLRYQVDLAGGQKTGFYLDQRENRKAAAAYFRDCRVLDMFCYSGGFALSRLRLGRRPRRVGGRCQPPRRGPGQVQCPAQRPRERAFRGGRLFPADGVAAIGRGEVRRPGPRPAPASPTAAAAWTTPCGRTTISIAWAWNCWSRAGSLSPVVAPAT